MKPDKSFVVALARNGVDRGGGCSTLRQQVGDVYETMICNDLAKHEHDKAFWRGSILHSPLPSFVAALVLVLENYKAPHQPTQTDLADDIHQRDE